MKMKCSILIFTAISWLKWTDTSPITDTCTDGSGVYLLDESLPCTMLLDPSAPRNAVYGVYSSRVALCEAGNHDCCTTCKQVYKQDAIETADPATCHDVPGSLWIADSGYSCHYLLDADLPNGATLGIYGARVSLCRQGVHQCCHACQQVFIEEGLTEVTEKVKDAQDNDQSATSEKTSTEATPNESTTNETIVDIVNLDTTNETDPINKTGSTEYEVGTETIETTEIDEAENKSTECKDKSFSLLDETFECDLLTSTASPAFVHRHRLCLLESTQCCFTCKTIQSPVTYTVETEDEPSLDSIEQVNVYRNVVPQLATLERRMHEKVYELQHEVDVLFGIFRQKKK